MDNFFKNDKLVSVYSRVQAIEDGILVDVSDTAKVAGIKYPVAVTQSVWVKYIEWTDDDKRRQAYQDQESRLWDIVFMLAHAIKKTDRQTDAIFYELHILPRDGCAYAARRTKLKAVVSADNNFEPVITIIMPEED